MYVLLCFVVFFFKQKTAYEMRISDWSSDVCSSDLSLTQGHDIRIAVDPDMPLLRVDYILIEQVLINLLDNAAKYSPKGSPIDLRLSRRKDAVMMDVTDQGQGIPPAELEQVFDMFYRAKGRDRPVAGTCLGLSICRSILKAHGGPLRAGSPPTAQAGPNLP